MVAAHFEEPTLGDGIVIIRFIRFLVEDGVSGIGATLTFRLFGERRIGEPFVIYPIYSLIISL